MNQKQRERSHNIPGSRSTPVWLNQEEAMKLQQAAAVLGCSRSELMRTILRFYMLDRFGGYGR